MSNVEEHCSHCFKDMRLVHQCNAPDTFIPERGKYALLDAPLEKIYNRIPFGKEKGLTRRKDLEKCPSCFVFRNAHHHAFCASEQCPACLDSIISCPCGRDEAARNLRTYCANSAISALLREHLNSVSYFLNFLRASTPMSATPHVHFERYIKGLMTSLIGDKVRVEVEGFPRHEFGFSSYEAIITLPHSSDQSWMYYMPPWVMAFIGTGKGVIPVITSNAAMKRARSCFRAELDKINRAAS